MKEILRIDAELEAMLLNHVARRASKAQGIALLSLYSRAFAALPEAGTAIDELMEELKSATRGRLARMQGHLPICFAVLNAALGLPLGE